MGNKGQQKAIILWNKAVLKDCFLMGVTVSAPIAKVTPGQFAMIRLEEGNGLLLRRPLSISGWQKADDNRHTMEFLYKVVGEGTLRLSRRRKGDELDLIAPLGHGFRYTPKHKRVFIVGGGIGVAPLRFLSHWLIEKGISVKQSHIFLGSRNKEELLCRKEFENRGFSITLTTDDGSFGDQCLITDPLEEAVSKDPPDMIYACGPMPMIACMSRFIKSLEVPCQVSLETSMACGLGACLGCAVPTLSSKEGYAHACVEGPVFDIREIEF